VSVRLVGVGRGCRAVAVFPLVGALAATLLLAACQTTAPPAPSVAGDPRDKVIETYGEPLARQHNGNVEVWQYCESSTAAADEGSEEGAVETAEAEEEAEAGPRRDRLHLVWLVDGVVTGESHHEYALDGCRRRYIVDLDSPPVRG